MAVKRDNDTNKWYYYGSYRVGNETKQYKKRGFDRKQDAIKAEVLFKESLKNPGSKMTLNEMIDIYMEFSEKKNQRIHLQKSYCYVQGVERCTRR